MDDANLVKSSDESELFDLLRKQSREDVMVYFQTVDEIVKRLSLRAGDQRLTYSSKSGGLTIIIGQRYCLTLGKDKDNVNVHVITSKRLNKDSVAFDGEPRAYGTNFSTTESLVIYRSELMSACEQELLRTTRSGFRKFSNEAFENAAFDLEYRARVLRRVFDSQTLGSLDRWIQKYKRLIRGDWSGKYYDELYKWETVQHFQDNWTDNHSSATILQLIRKSFLDESNNLWSGQGYFPYAMLIGFAEKYPEKLSDMFRMLYDEGKPLEPRFEKFRKEAIALTESMFPGEDKSHYQDDRALTVYLNLRYPDRYYLYKSKMFREFCELTGYWAVPKTKKGDTFAKVTEYLKMCDSLNKVLKNDTELMELHRRRIPSSITLKDNDHLLTQDFVYAVTRYLNDEAMIDTDPEPDSMTNDHNPMALNQILFGPPGTGKTYHTINEAVKIVDPEFYEANRKERDQLRRRFEELLIRDWNDSKGQIAFCTFHQSFSYEDFVEGIKPVKPKEGDGFLKYEIEDGIFKRLCQLSNDSRRSQELKSKGLFSWSESEFAKADFYKISLGDANNPEDHVIYDYCIRNNCIALGYGDMNDFSGLNEKEVVVKAKELQFDSFASQALNYFIHYLKRGNYVLVSNGNRYVRAIGRITGDYRYDPSGNIRYNHFRAVEWLVVNQSIPISELYDRNLSQMTIYKLDGDGIRKDFFVGSKVPKPISDKRFVLIIDEINRGNVSSIFGELITLIERDKRAGGKEQLAVTLPYSKEQFMVPDNVYIVGTMNTADRSIEALDTALRRRFEFKEMPSDPALIRTEGKLSPSGKVGDIDVVMMLQKINERIGKLVDRDHKIGHSYFLEIETEKDLKVAFRHKVIPLLEEYFFGDFGKIGLVLGESFVKKDDPKDFSFAKFTGYEDRGVVEDLKNRSIYRITPDDEWDFKSVYA